MDYRLVVLDIDGTLLDTPHLPAWQQAVAQVTEGRRPALTTDQYQLRVAGRPRLAGARAALEAVGAAPDGDLVTRLASVKQELFHRLADTTVLFPDAQRFLVAAVEQEIPLAFCTASRNAGALLRARLTGHPHGARLIERLERSLAPAGYRDEPAREDALRRVGRIWDTDPAKCLLIDDADHGVAAGERSGMDAVLLDRFMDPANWPADRRITSLDEIGRGQIFSTRERVWSDHE
ncbi:hypothetical protein XF35_24780 [Streptomyces platensis subsp. clarensis]|nr:hypothetical protein [Streptomyces platensis subsp. clarensis]